MKTDKQIEEAAKEYAKTESHPDEQNISYYSFMEGANFMKEDARQMADRLKRAEELLKETYGFIVGNVDSQFEVEQMKKIKEFLKEREDKK